MKAILIGSLVVLSISSVTLGASLIFEWHTLGYGAWLSMVIGSFIVAAKEPRRKFMYSVLLAMPASIILAGLNYLYGVLGIPVDFGGMRGALVVVVMALPIAIILCAIGGGIGHVYTHNK
ncbi:hypothetical protein [Zooshikella ganghwensis]|uniref:Uncharacterized protein n=1 Tax=Zooshikella ganghwensis TaxID=202772 RepID=A0A4V1INA4_9GAMM|nr:hypothetical protein [Zooshikella ganghwensis]RDH43041.1 hypothetical protein B9G39_06010 [Zooshikella ganghwensis]